MSQVNTHSPVAGVANFSGGDPSTISLQLRFAQLQMALAETAKQGALDYMDAIEQIQKEQQEVAGYLQEARQAQADAKSTGKPTPMSPEMQAYMDENGLAYEKTAAEKSREKMINSCQEQIRQNNANIDKAQTHIDHNNQAIAEAQAKIDKNNQEIQAIRDKYPNKSPVTGIPFPMSITDQMKFQKLSAENSSLKQGISALQGQNAQLKNHISALKIQNAQLEKQIAMLEAAPISYDADQWEVAITSLKAQQDQLGTNTQQMMVYIQDFMGQYNSYLQGANSAVQQSNQTLADLARLR